RHHARYRPAGIQGDAGGYSAPTRQESGTDQAEERRGAEGAENPESNGSADRRPDLVLRADTEDALGAEREIRVLGGQMLQSLKRLYPALLFALTVGATAANAQTPVEIDPLGNELIH